MWADRCVLFSQTALHVACQYGQLGAVARLIALNAVVDLPAHGGARPMTIAAVSHMRFVCFSHA